MGFWLYLTVFALFGALLGGVLASALICLIQRRKNGEPWAALHGEQTRSHCDSCGHVLGAADLVPVWSYLLLRGRCRYCGTKIPPTSFYLELLWSVIFGLLTVTAVLFYDFPAVLGISGAVSLALLALSALCVGRKR